MQAMIDSESRVRDAHHDALRLWLRLFACSQLVERAIRVRLRREFGTTLPRFDFLAQLERNAHGLKMGELSKRLMVTGGNITSLTDQLVKEGLVKRQPISGDRRAFAVQLTTKGKRTFDAMASAHEQWVIGLLAGMTVAERRSLYALLGRAKASVRRLDESAEEV
jgi:DNA-binding MarR family transcriptional regulator